MSGRFCQRIRAGFAGQRFLVASLASFFPSKDIMFKNSKTSSGFKNSRLSSAEQIMKQTLESLGYSFDSASKKSGWAWSTQRDHSDGNKATEAEAVEDAWQHAAGKAQAGLDIPEETWARMGTGEQADMITEALTQR